MKSLSDTLSTTFSRKKSPGLNEICTLLNFEESPVALVDRNKQEILFINTQLVKLTAFPVNEIWQKPVTQLFPDLNLDTVSSGEVITFTLIRRNQPQMHVKARIDFIDPKSQWIVIRFLSNFVSDEDKKSQTRDLFKQLIQFTKVSDENELQQVLKQSIEIAQRIFQVDSVCLYQADPSSPQLVKTAMVGNPTDFINTLPSTDLIRLDKPFLWKPGIRVLTELHRYARINNIEYVGSAPLIQGGGTFGLLTAAGRCEMPVNLDIEILELVAAMVLSIFQQYSLVTNLNQKISTAQSGLILRNTMLENMMEGLLVLNDDFKIVEINQAAEWMLGYANLEVKDQMYENILIGTDRLLPALLDAKKGKTTYNLGNVMLHRRNGQRFPVQAKVIPAMMNDHLEGIEILISDISEKEQSKAQNQQLEHRAVLGDYTSAFAHDIRNPINNISTGLQLLSATLPEDDPNHDVINRMQGDCARLTHMMESFLAFSRPIDLKLENIDVGNFMKMILDRWQPRMARVNVKSSLHVGEEVSKIIGDPRSLERVFTNLISNAIEAMTDNGDSLVVKAENDHEVPGFPQVAITISDNGPGIPEDIREHIFEPFITTRSQGTGLGLAITKQIVTAHKGNISVNSFPGGTVFTVRIPAASGENS